VILLSSLLLALPTGAADLTEALLLLRAGHEYEALQALEALDPTDETRFWTMRARVRLGQVTEALEAADSGELSGSDAGYLRGIAFHALALDAIAQGQGGLVDFQFRDAATSLASATSTDADRYADAFTPLTEALWHTQQLELARSAGEQAAQHTTSNPRSHLLLGEVCFSQFIVARSDETKAELALVHRQAASQAFRVALGAIDAKRSGHATMGAKAASKLGDIAVWAEEPERAAKEYAVAVSWDPSQVNYAQLNDSLGSRGLVTCLKQGCAAFEERYGERDASESTPLWWLGFAQFSEKEYADADQTFGRVLELFPAYTNSWWYRAEARFHQENLDGFLECLRELSGRGMELLAAQVNSAPGHNLSVLSGGIAKLNNAQRFADAAYLCEVRVAATPNNWEYWDNLALFCRDAGTKLMGGSRRALGKTKDEARLSQATRYFERALLAYAKAYELDSTKPHLLNDRAVILDYYLNRDLDEAMKLYARALEQANALLADPEALSDFERQLAETAQRDGANNMRLLERRIERERKKRDREERKKKREAG
jgi:tetratricopeptide (TPR) repeat protein